MAGAESGTHEADIGRLPVIRQLGAVLQAVVGFVGPGIIAQFHAQVGQLERGTFGQRPFQALCQGLLIGVARRLLAAGKAVAFGQIEPRFGPVQRLRVFLHVGLQGAKRLGVIPGEIHLLCAGEVHLFLLGFRTAGGLSQAVHIGQVGVGVLLRTVDGLDGQERVFGVFSATGHHGLVIVQGVLAAAGVTGNHAQFQQGTGLQRGILGGNAQRIERLDGGVLLLQGHVGTAQFIEGLPVIRSVRTGFQGLFQQGNLLGFVAAKAAGHARHQARVQVVGIRVISHLPLIGRDGRCIVPAEEIAVPYAGAGIGPLCPGVAVQVGVEPLEGAFVIGLLEIGISQLIRDEIALRLTGQGLLVVQFRPHPPGLFIAGVAVVSLGQIVAA